MSEKFIIKVNRKSINELPTTTGVYLFKQDKEILYVGKSVNLKARLLSHLENAKLDNKEAAIVGGSNRIECIITDSEFNALLLEARLINKIQPKYNIRWKDDKSNLYIQINPKDDYPKVAVLRKTALNYKINYFGPFPTTYSIEIILKEIRRVFPYCSQKNIGRFPCFYSKIGLCHPCPNVIEHAESITEKRRLKRLYRKNIRNIIKVFEGKTELVLDGLSRNLRMTAKEQRYEEALEIRNKINHFNHLINRPIFTGGNENYRYNQSADSLDSLSKLLKHYYPEINVLDRIECYDISNLGHKDSTASLVVFSEGLIDKSQYRKFKIKNLKLQSDFEMMEEVLNRRFKRRQWLDPNLIVVDGGKPQVRIAQKVLVELKINIPVIGIAKNPDRLIIGIENLPMVKPSNNHLGFNLIKAIRDESHRFARKYHLLLRNKRLLI